MAINPHLADFRSPISAARHTMFLQGLQKEMFLDNRKVTGQTWPLMSHFKPIKENAPEGSGGRLGLVL